MNFTAIDINEINMDKESCYSFHVLIETDKRNYYLECYAEATFGTDDVSEGRGYEPEVLLDSKIEIVDGHSVDEEDNVYKLTKLDITELEEILKNNISIINN